MSNPVRPSQSTDSAATQPGRPSAEIRIGDAERTEVADRLAKHFSDGRLDEAEFGERLDRAMRAKTMADLMRLLADLPSQPTPPREGDRRHQRRMLRTQLERERLALKAEQRAHRRAAREVRWRSLRLLVMFVAVIVGALIIIHWLAHSAAIWIIIGVIAFLWVRRNAARSHRGTGRDPDYPPPRDYPPPPD
jgi:Flp pilus assembly protein TadB